MKNAYEIHFMSGLRVVLAAEKLSEAVAIAHQEYPTLGIRATTLIAVFNPASLLKVKP